MSDESDPDTLRKRVSELEEIVQSQQQTIAKMLPGRRNVLKGAGLLTGGALAGAAATERAEAQTGPAGQVGTSSEPVDAFAWNLDIDNVMSHNGDNALIDVAASGSVTLSSGSATVTVETASGSTYYLALGTDDNAKVSGRIFDDGDVSVEIVETETSVGNPTVNYDVLRVR